MPKYFGSSIRSVQATSTYSMAIFTYHFSTLIGLPTWVRVSIAWKQANPAGVYFYQMQFFQAKNLSTSKDIICLKVSANTEQTLQAASQPK